MYQILHWIKRIYWGVFKPKTVGVKCVICYKNKNLMIKRTLANSKWVFPGGAVKKGESYEEAIKREIKEDLGIKLENVVEIGSFVKDVLGRVETMYCFKAQVATEKLVKDDRRIGEAKWFDRDKLPWPLTPISQMVFELYKK